MSTMPEQDTCQHFDIQATHEGVICVECGMLFDNVQRALDAERERDEANKELLLLHAQYRQVSNLEALRVREIAALRAERDALRADLLALAPLAKYALPLWEDCGPNERLRAILARVTRIEEAP